MDKQELTPNEKHKSSVFSLLFSNPDILRELYSAIEGVPLPPDIPININTLSDALIKGKINDISFLIDNRLVVLIEHQSTINSNMPLRILQYITKIYEKTIDFTNVYREKQIKYPKPKFIVLYNGEKPYPDKKELRFSDAFLNTEGLTENDEMTLELVVQVYNINHGHNPEIQQKCKTLNSYSYFIDKIREYEKTGLTLANSVECAVKYCIERNVLKDFLREHGSEMSNMLFYEYDFDTHMAVIREETREERSEEIALNLLAKGSTHEFIHEVTGLDPVVISRLQRGTDQR